MIYIDHVHMVADSLSELHSFARQIGLKRCWYDGNKKHPHYDLGLSHKFRQENRLRALAFGAQPVDSKTILLKSKGMLNNTQLKLG